MIKRTYVEGKGVHHEWFQELGLVGDWEALVEPVVRVEKLKMEEPTEVRVDVEEKHQETEYVGRNWHA